MIAYTQRRKMYLRHYRQKPWFYFFFLLPKMHSNIDIKVVLVILFLNLSKKNNHKLEKANKLTRSLLFHNKCVPFFDQILECWWLSPNYRHRHFVLIIIIVVELKLVKLTIVTVSFFSSSIKTFLFKISSLHKWRKFLFRRYGSSSKYGWICLNYRFKQRIIPLNFGQVIYWFFYLLKGILMSFISKSLLAFTSRLDWRGLLWYSLNWTNKILAFRND